ncbi:MAG TPA: homoserine dehydrogenase [Isosphaeraceae bacterium]|nr:homoserine dehydrogenase [Isosphaeraceae bacterium]
MNPVTIGLIGLGTVGTGVARLLTEHPDRLARRAGRPFRWKWAVVRDPAKARGVALEGVQVTTDVGQLLDDPEVEVVIETMGGTDPALGYVLAALAAGKHVVTANKALLAEHGAEVFARARAAGRAVAFEGSVGGGIPIVQALGVALAANQVQSLAAIVNGTCNFILTRMTEEGLPYEEALRQAQQLGYAEADPTLDVDGTDTAHKLAILAQLAFEADVRLEVIPRQGIDRLQLADLKYAGELGYVIKLLALAKLSAAGLELRVAPTLVRRGTPLAEVRGPYNAIRVVGDAVGDTLFYGRGAGAMPTASAVIADLIDVATGRAGLPSRSRTLWSESAPPVCLTPPSQIQSRYHLRFTIADRPGVLAQLAQILGDHGISIASVIQHDPGDDAPADSPVPLVIMTHHAIQADLHAALEEIDRLGVVHAPSVCLGVED